MIPLNDTEPNRYSAFPYMTVTLIVVNTVILIWELTLPMDTLRSVFWIFGINPKFDLGKAGRRDHFRDHIHVSAWRNFPSPWQYAFPVGLWPPRGRCLRPGQIPGLLSFGGHHRQPDDCPDPAAHDISRPSGRAAPSLGLWALILCFSPADRFAPCGLLLLSPPGPRSARSGLCCITCSSKFLRQSIPT